MKFLQTPGNFADRAIANYAAGLTEPQRFAAFRLRNLYDGVGVVANISWREAQPSRDALSASKHADALVAKWSKVGDTFDDLVHRLRQGLAKGRTPPRTSVPARVRVIEDAAPRRDVRIAEQRVQIAHRQRTGGEPPDQALERAQDGVETLE